MIALRKVYNVMQKLKSFTQSINTEGNNYGINKYGGKQLLTQSINTEGNNYGGKQWACIHFVYKSGPQSFYIIHFRRSFSGQKTAHRLITMIIIQ